MNYSWILASGGAGRGAWQGGVIYEFMRWCREKGCFPSITMGAFRRGREQDDRLLRSDGVRRFFNA